MDGVKGELFTNFDKASSWCVCACKFQVFPRNQVYRLNCNLYDEHKFCCTMKPSCFFGYRPKISRFADGSLLVEVETTKQSSKMKVPETLDRTPVKVYPHSLSNFFNCAVCSRKLLCYSVEKKTKEIPYQGVARVKRVSKRSDGVRRPPPAHFVIFDQTHLSESLIVDCYNL